MTNLNEDLIFSKGEKITNNYFIGTTYIDMLLANDSTFDFSIGNVTFEPGARNNWHTHPYGQILLVTLGTGYFQEEGKPVQIIKKGDVIKINPNVKHWHGATPDSSMTHVAIQKGEIQWLEPVTDEEYKKY